MGKKQERDYSLYAVRWLVGRIHVFTPDSQVVRDFWRRTEGWPLREQRKMAIRDALKIHRENRDLYYKVMRGL